MNTVGVGPLSSADGSSTFGTDGEEKRVEYGTKTIKRLPRQLRELHKGRALSGM